MLERMRRRSAVRATLLAAAALVGAVALAGAGCAPAAPAGGGNRAARLRVVTTTAHVADLVRGVAGERAPAESLMGEGVDPHTYKLTRSDSVRLSEAGLVLYSGLHLEGKMTEVLEGMAAAGRPVVEVAKSVPPELLLRLEDAGGQADPHYWMDPTLWSEAAAGVGAALAKADPAGEAEFGAGVGRVRRELAELDRYAAEVLGSIPAERRVLLTSHDAFNYLGRRYGLRVMGVQGISTESEAGVKDVENLVAVIVREKVPAVFVESSVSPRTIEAVVAGARARGHEVKVGGSLFSDALGAPGTYEGTYLGMMDHNVTTIARALGGKAPAGGLRGRLKEAEGTAGGAAAGTGGGR